MVLSADLEAIRMSARLRFRERQAITYPERASRPSGDISVLRTQEEWPDREATAPEPGLPEAEVRTSCRISRLSSDADRRS